MVIFLLDEIQRLNINVNYDQALKNAAIHGYINIVKKLNINNNINLITFKDLQKMMDRGHYETVKYLLENGININKEEFITLRYNYLRNKQG